MENIISVYTTFWVFSACSWNSSLLVIFGIFFRHRLLLNVLLSLLLFYCRSGGQAVQIVQRHHFASHLKRMAVVVRIQEEYLAFVKVGAGLRTRNLWFKFNNSLFLSFFFFFSLFSFLIVLQTHMPQLATGKFLEKLAGKLKVMQDTF